MAVFTILGAALFSASLGDTKHAISQDRKTQAHYIARSGVYVGLDILDKQLISKKYTDLNTLIIDLNTTASLLSTENKKVGDKGNYTITYEKFSPNEVKIKSIGKLADSSNIEEIVTLTVSIQLAIGMQSNPREWFTGINLQKGLRKSSKYIGSGVELAGNPVQSPKNGDDSIFQGSLIYFRDSRGTSFRQIMNSVGVTFDAEIIYYESKVELNRSFNPVILSISSDILDFRASKEGIIPKYSPPVGFEDYGRYKTFIGGHSSDMHSTYKNQFMPGSKYGLVYFGEDVVVNMGGTVINKGYYYYRDGVNLHSPTQGEYDGYKNLIQIPSDDAVIKALNSMFTSSANRSGLIWNRK